MYFASIVRTRNRLATENPSAAPEVGRLAISRVNQRGNPDVPFIILQSVIGETLNGAIDHLAITLENYRAQYPGYGVRIISGKINGQVIRPAITYEIVDFTRDHPDGSEIVTSPDEEYDDGVAYSTEVA